MTPRDRLLFYFALAVFALGASMCVFSTDGNIRKAGVIIAALGMIGQMVHRSLLRRKLRQQYNRAQDEQKESTE